VAVPVPPAVAMPMVVGFMMLAVPVASAATKAAAMVASARHAAVAVPVVAMIVVVPGLQQQWRGCCAATGSGLATRPLTLHLHLHRHNGRTRTRQQLARLAQRPLLICARPHHHVHRRNNCLSVVLPQVCAVYRRDVREPPNRCQRRGEGRL